MSPLPSSTVDERLKTLFNDYLPKAGIRLSQGEDEDDSSITLVKGNSIPLVGEIRHLNPASAVGIEGLVMRGMLRHLELNGPNLLIIVVPRLAIDTALGAADGQYATLLPGADQRHQRLGPPADHPHLGDRRLDPLREFRP